MRTTPFHERANALNRTQLWTHWAGYLSAVRYDHSATIEYFATRNAVALFDSSPLFKYRIAGPDSERFLAGVLTRDIRTCPPGSAQYTIWCDDEGYVIEDGVALRLNDDEFLLTSAEPNLDYFQKLVGRDDVKITDISEEYGLLAVQGPHSLNALRKIAPGVERLKYFDVMNGTISGCDVIISRTGFTADLGYEIWAPREHAIAVWDAVMSAGHDYNAIPMGMSALGMARLDGGLLLIDVDFGSSRHAWTPAFKETPTELGLGWMLANPDDRPFVGKQAIGRELRNHTSRWRTVGFALDPMEYESLFNSQGLIAPKEGVYVEEVHSLYDRDYNHDRDAAYLGYASSFGFSPIAKRHIGLAKLPLDHTPGSTVYLELMVANAPRYVRAEVTRTPFWNPARKTEETTS